MVSLGGLHFRTALESGEKSIVYLESKHLQGIQIKNIWACRLLFGQDPLKIPCVWGGGHWSGSSQAVWVCRGGCQTPLLQNIP